jgi:hypothetical protein
MSFPKKNVIDAKSTHAQELETPRSTSTWPEGRPRPIELDFESTLRVRAYMIKIQKRISKVRIEEK